MHLQSAVMLFHLLLTLDKQDLISELFCKTNSGGRGRNPPVEGICGKSLFLSRFSSDFKFKRRFGCIMDVRKNVL